MGELYKYFNSGNIIYVRINHNIIDLEKTLDIIQFLFFIEETMGRKYQG